MTHLRKTYSADQLRDYSLLFSSGEINRLVRDGGSKLINNSLRKYDSSFLARNNTYGDYYKYLYKVLQKHYTNEYVYKNDLINRYLLKERLGNKLSLYSELNLGNVIVDLAVFGEKSRGFEIKSDLDTPHRVATQMEVYSQVFNETYLVVPEEKVELYRPYFKEEFGVLSYNKRSRSFTVAQELPSQSRVSPNPKQLMEILLAREYRHIVEQYYGKEILKYSTDFTRFSDCSSLIADIPPEALNRLFISAMKSRRKAISLFSNEYSELNQALLSMRSDERFRDRLLFRLRETISTHT